jgi:hypothetical protein
LLIEPNFPPTKSPQSRKVQTYMGVDRHSAYACSIQRRIWFAGNFISISISKKKKFSKVSLIWVFACNCGLAAGSCVLLSCVCMNKRTKTKGSCKKERVPKVEKNNKIKESIKHGPSPSSRSSSLFTVSSLNYRRYRT